MAFLDESGATILADEVKTYVSNTAVAKEDGKGLSSNDYTTTEKNKLAGIAEGANKTVVDSSLDASSENPVQNKVIAGEIVTLKKSVSDGKTLVATAITDKGVETAADATFAVMADNISQIETGGGELHGATISVTTTEETLIGKTITLSLNSTTVATRTFDDNGACSFTDIQEAGTYVMYSSDGTDSAELSVEITAENIINKTVISCEFYLTPDGETVTPVDDVATLLKCAEIKDKSYTTMDELLGDEQAIGDVTMSENAMKYLARSTGFADDVCANETFMTCLGASAYVDSTVLNSDLWLSAIANSPYCSEILQPVDLNVGSAYFFGGYEWVVAEKSDVSGYAVLQSTGVTSGAWCGYAMSGTLTNAAGSTIDIGSANSYYTGNIDGYDISNYNSTTQSLYSSIKAVEYKNATYGKGLYLVSNAKTGTTTHATQGSGNYWAALKSAAVNHSSFGTSSCHASLGTVDKSNKAWYVYQDGGVGSGYDQDLPNVVAPAFNVNTRLIKLNGNTIEPLIK